MHASCDEQITVDNVTWITEVHTTVVPMSRKTPSKSLSSSIFESQLLNDGLILKLKSTSLTLIGIASSSSKGEYRITVSFLYILHFRTHIWVHFTTTYHSQKEIMNSLNQFQLMIIDQRAVTAFHDDDPQSKSCMHAQRTQLGSNRALLLTLKQVSNILLSESEMVEMKSVCTW